MAPNLTIDDIDPDFVIVEGQRLERKTASRSEWLKFWHDAKRRAGGQTFAQAWNAGYEARAHGSAKAANPF